MTKSPLKKKILRQIETQGPMTVADYMGLCLSDPQAGYYTARNPFGAAGDFVTAPEISQIFGELIGAFLVEAYERMGSPGQFHLIELGPGRGTLMADILRVGALRRSFLQAARLTLVETSPRLRNIQKQTLSDAPLAPTFATHVQEIPDGPLLLVANEFFDALPIHQFVKTKRGWRERMISCDHDNALMFGIGTAKLPDEAVPRTLTSAPYGTILETQPAANAIAEQIAARIAARGGAALFIDYGYLKTAAGDTLQALRNHAYDDVLTHPGEADLTAHVNFEALAKAASTGGAHVFSPLEQGEFLLHMGLLERAGVLGRGKSHAEQEKIRDDVERLAGPDQMGQLFKVLAMSGSDAPFPPFDSLPETTRRTEASR